MRAKIDRLEEFIKLLHEYGHAKFGDEWWPGNPDEWLPPEKAARLKELAEQL